MGLQRFICEKKPQKPLNIHTDEEFYQLRNVCDRHYRDLYARGIGTEVNSTTVLSPSDEDKLWKSGILNLHSHIGLLRAVFFHNGKTLFTLWTGT